MISTLSNKLSRKELEDIVNKIIECNGTEEEIDNMIRILENNVVDPNVTDLIYYSNDNLTAEEIIDIAMNYEVIKI